jgi:pyruvate,orthophosphate dikinase
MKMGICGEHGGDPKSVEFCHHVGLDYVSCSPYRLPIARLAAAQAALSEPRSAAKPAKVKVEKSRSASGRSAKSASGNGKHLAGHANGKAAKRAPAAKAPISKKARSRAQARA